LSWGLTLQYEESTGAKILLDMLLIEYQSHATSFQLGIVCLYFIFIQEWNYHSKVFHTLFFYKVKQYTYIVVPGLMFSCKHSFVHISILPSFSVYVMTAKDYWRESSTSISSSVSVQCIHCVFLCCQGAVCKQLQIHVNCLKLFMEMKLYLT
jgi:hypothetical protein